MTDGPMFFTMAGLAIAGLGLPLWRRKVRPNRFYGVRTAATVGDEARWYAINASTGRTMIIVGIMTSSCSVGLWALGLSGSAHTLVMAAVLVSGGVVVSSTGLRQSREADAMRLQFRDATADDHAFLRNLNRLAYQDVVTRQLGAWDERAQRERFDAKLKRAAFRIVELAGRPIAAVWTSENDDHAVLHELLVLPDFQNRGIGSQILRREMAQADAARKPLRLHTLALNRAQVFYKRHGFIEIGREDGYVDMERPMGPTS